jgi:hypothetical protein
VAQLPPSRPTLGRLRRILSSLLSHAKAGALLRHIVRLRETASHFYSGDIQDQHRDPASGTLSRRKVVMEAPTWLKPAITGGIVGAIATMITGFSYGGWMLGSSAETMA